MAVSEVYLDESYDHRGPPLLCIGAYVFRKSKARRFTTEWGGYLKRNELPYFHMSECAHGVGIFKGRGDADAVARELIRQTRALSDVGIAIAVNMEDYERLLRGRHGMPTAYGFALFALITHVQRWREATGGGRYSFFFERGHQHENDANQFLNFMYQSERVAASHGYTGHAFVQKETPCVHPADFLAWHWHLETKRSLDPKRKFKRRADLEALGRDQDKLLTYNLKHLEQLNGMLQDAEVERGRIMREAEARGQVPLEWSAARGVTKWIDPRSGEVEAIPVSA